MNKTETKKCQNCKQQFTIEPDDFDFYNKIKVPPPTFCPECRMQRRMAFRNERTLYKRDCDLCNKVVISAYPKAAQFTIYCSECWWGDSWDPMKYGQGYNPTKPFLTQWKELQSKVPRPYVNNLTGATMVNSEYTNCAGELKNCYLVYGSMRDEDCAYSHYLNYSRHCFDNLYCIKGENCYDCLDIENCYGLQYSQSCVGCRDSTFLFDCRNCSDCIGCVGLRNKKYYILNKPYAKEEYFEKKDKLALHTRTGIKSFQEQYKNVYYSSPRKYYHGQMNKDFSGDYIANTENTHQSFYIKHARGCKFVFWCNNAEDVYDYMSWGDMELSYECVSNGYNSYHCLFTDASWSDNKDLEYCSLCFTSSNLFGCIGLRSKKHCILNKQYSEVEYKSLREKIIGEMKTYPYRDIRGIPYLYGEFPPIELSPFLYTDTVAQEHFPLTKEEIIKNGFRWEERKKRNYIVTIKAEELPETIDEIDDSILDAVIECVHKGECNDQCTEAFKIIVQELQFYRKMNIPLPQLCYNCRHSGRVAARNPLKLWHRQCQCAGEHSDNKVYTNTSKFHQPHELNEHCPNEFETTYALDRKEIIYCEKCYQQEVV
ncbi:hypothetical protein MYX07_03075 [Patescibacteria group bacterium AH-259-L07]|nr:hypothetical protein [Patescibacteria group bacterium AH-259-L07]